MDTNRLLTSWSTLSYDEIEQQLQESDDAGEADQLFGEDEAAQMRSLAATPPTRGLKKSVVLLPGVMGSLLHSIRGVTNLTWINPLLFVRGEAGYLMLSDDGTRDAHPEIDTVPIGTEKLTYLKFALTLRKEFELFEFPYDWRRPIEYNADLLHECLERWAADDDRTFTLIGHSMGGIVSRSYLARHTEAAEKRIERLIMQGSPHFGAAGAVESMVMGNSMTEIAARLNAANDLVALVRNLPSVYQLVPAPPDLFPSGRPYPVNWDVYDARAWRVEGIRQDYLDLARSFNAELAGADPQVETIEIAGCQIETVVDVKRSFDSDDRATFESVRVDRGEDSGDGTVPLWSSRLPGASLYYVQEVHRDMPKSKPVIEATIELASDGKASLPTALPEPKSGWFGREALEPPEVEAERLRQRIEAGTATEDDLSKLYFAL